MNNLHLSTTAFTPALVVCFHARSPALWLAAPCPVPCAWQTRSCNVIYAQSQAWRHPVLRGQRLGRRRAGWPCPNTLRRPGEDFPSGFYTLHSLEKEIYTGLLYSTRLSASHSLFFGGFFPPPCSASKELQKWNLPFVSHLPAGLAPETL